MDGWITIGTELETKTFDKKYEKLKNRLENAEITLKIKTDDLEDARNELKMVQRELTEINQKRNEINSEVNKYQKQYDDINNRILTGQGVTGEEYQRFGFLENKLTDLKSQQTQINNEFDKYNQKVNKSTDILSKAETKYDIQKKKVEELRGEFQELVSEMKKSEGFDFSGIKKNADNIGESIKNIIKKIGRWTIAIFGVRSAYMFIRQSISTLSQYNEQLATDIQYIRFALASALQPIIERIIQLVYKLLSFIGAISKTLIGKNIFENSGIDKFSKGISKSAKSAKELNKQLAGFDEMNVLQDTSSTTSGGDGVNATPSIDLSKIDEQAEQYVKKMKDIADIVTSFWEEEWKSYFNNATGNWGDFFKGLLLTLEGFYKVFKGIFEMIGGLVDIFVGIFTGDVDKIKQGWDKMVKGLFDIFKGILDMIIGIFISFKGLVKGILLTITDLIIGFVNAFVTSINQGINKVINFFLLLPKAVNDIIKKISGLFGNFGTKVGEVIGGAFKIAINGALSAIESILNSPIKAINGLMDAINKVPGINLKKLSTFKLPRLARGGIVNNPGPGVMMGSYVAGESGPEAVLPLTDDTLQRLANMIPITVNVTNTMNGRVLSRELQRVQNERNFAFNR